ncbi:MAG: GspE/PulE family protein [Syntrophothermaceae bacterium]
MKVRYGWNYLGNMLVAAGIITQSQLQEALEQQKIKVRNGGKGLLGRTLMEMGYCTEEDIARVMAEQAGVPYLSLESYTVDETAVGLITPEMARRYHALPLGFDQGRLIVAMMNPNDVIAIDDLRLLTGYDIQPVMVPDSELEAVTRRMVHSNLETRPEPAAKPEEPVLPPDAVENRPVVQLVNMILNQAVQARASDIHIEPRERDTRVRFRIDGVLHTIMHRSADIHALLVSRIKVMANMDIAERRVPQDGRMTIKLEGRTIDVRAASLPTAYGEKLTLRLLDPTNQLITLEQLGFPPHGLEKYVKIMCRPYGFIPVTGPTGSGKSTTLYATLAALNTEEKHIITVEDPIEYRVEGINQVQINPRAGLTFATGLRSILRNDPDIIMVGEIRDQETARIAVESALTGHLVLSTLHTNDAAGAITRLGDMGIEPFLVASSLMGVVAQRLVRLLCPHCKEAYQLSRESLLASVPDFPLPAGKDSVRLYRPRGCLRCSNTGYRGRIGVYELLLMSETIQGLTLQRCPSRDIREAAVAEGMVTLRQDGLRKVGEGLTSLEEVIRVVV